MKKDERTDGDSKDRIAADASTYWRSGHVNAGVRSASHWLDHGVGGNPDSWERIGPKHVRLYSYLRVLSLQTRRVTSMIEWGPGGGANAIHFSKEFKRCYGVDISSANLDECARQIDSRNPSGSCEFIPVLFDIENPKSVLQTVTEPVDFFLATAVFQHFPSKEYGQEVTEVAHKALAPDGVALIQTRYDDGTELVQSKDRDYCKNVITFTSHKIDEYWKTAEQAGFEPLAVVLEPEAKYAYYLLKKAGN